MHTERAASPHTSAALTLILEKKDDENLILQSNYASMREQMKTLRAAALSKLGLPPEAAAPADEAAAAGVPAEAAADEADEDTQWQYDPSTGRQVRCDAAAPAAPGPRWTPQRPQRNGPGERLEDLLKQRLPEALREPLQRLDAAALAAGERGREWARGLGGALARLRPTEEQQLQTPGGDDRRGM